MFIVLGAIARLSGFSLWKFLLYMKDEIFTVLGTSSSKSVVPQLMRKLEYIGISKPVVGLVVAELSARQKTLRESESSI